MSVGAVCLRIARAILTVSNSYNLFIWASPYHRLKKSNVKNIRNTIKSYESRSKSQNSAKAPTLQDLS